MLEEVGEDFERMAEFYAERARGQVGLIVTGGIGPNKEGLTLPISKPLMTVEEAEKHKVVILVNQLLLQLRW